MAAEQADNLDEAKVKYLADLARLNLTDEEATAFSKQLSAIVDYFDMLNEVDISDVTPAHMLDVYADAFREDVPQPCMTTEDLLAVVPHAQVPFVRVAPVFDN